MTLLGHANPIPNEESLELDSPRLEDLELRRSGTMTDLGTTPRPTDNRRRRPYMAGLAAAAVVVLTGFALVLINLTGEPSPAAGEPIEIAHEFIDARNEYDGARMASLFETDADLAFEVVDSVSRYPALAEFERAIGWEYRLGNCTEEPHASEGWVRVNCPYQSENDWSRAFGMGPFGEQSNFQLVIADGKIQSLFNDMDFEQFQPVFGEFFAWLETTHPQDVPRMLDLQAGAPLYVPYMTPDAIELWERHTDEFVASVGS